MAIWVLFFIILLSSSCIFSSTSANKLPAGFPFSASLATKRSTNKTPYKQKYFTQTLDHFNYAPASYQTFQQRYLINDTYWGDGGREKRPVFVYTGNEGNIEWFAQNTGFMFEKAPRFKALIVFIEQRFYGKSLPFGGKREIAYANTSTLGYLSSAQALADYATLILDLKKNLTAEDSPVIVFGGSLGGMLAAWFRLKYPHVALGALASSAPILNFDNITSPYNFNDIITQDFRSESESCYKVIKRSWQEIEDVASKPGGLKILAKSFKICKNLKSAGDLEDWLATAYSYTAMTDYPTPANFITPLPAYPVKQMCKAIDDPRTGNNTLKKIYAAANIYYNYTGQEGKCFYLYDDSDSDSDSQGLGYDVWEWQTCTEMVLQSGGSKEDSIFRPSKYSYNYQYCLDMFNTTPRPTWIPTEFGGHDIKRVLGRFGSNIIFSNGGRDPWSGGGVLKNISQSIVAIVAEKGAHHVDLRYSTSKDPEWLRDMRNKEVQIISNWLTQYYHDLSYHSGI